FGMDGFDETIEDIELNLELGTNEFTFKVVDLGGHETTETVTVERSTSTANMQKIVDNLRKSGDVKDDSIARMLNMQLEAIGHYADSDQTKKAVKHMNNFKQLMDALKETDKLTGEATVTLHEHADYLLEKWQ